MPSALQDGKLRFARATLAVWKAKLRREYQKWAEKDGLVRFVKELGEQVKAAALEAGAGLPRTAALDRLAATIDAEVEDYADEILRFDVRPDDLEQINKTLNGDDGDDDGNE